MITLIVKNWVSLFPNFGVLQGFDALCFHNKACGQFQEVL